MTIQIYYFGQSSVGYTQYPTDFTHNFFEEFLKKGKLKVQIIAHRQGDLLYYGYVRHLDSGKPIGICIATDAIFTNNRDLFQTFDDAFSSLIEDGSALRFLDDGTTTYNTGLLSDEMIALEENATGLKQSVTSLEYIPLPPPDYSVSNKAEMKLSLEGDIDPETGYISPNDDAIVSALQTYSNVIISKKRVDIERVTSASQIISSQKRTIVELTTQIAELNRKQKQYALVALLLFVIILGAVIFFSINRDLKDNLSKTNGNLIQTKGELYRIQQDNDKLQSDNDNLEQRCDHFYNQLCQKIEEIDTLQYNYQQKELELEEEKNKVKLPLSPRRPFFITKTDFDYNSGRLTFSYVAPTSKTVSFVVKVYEGCLITQTSQITRDILQGEHSIQMYVSTANIDRSKWNTFEVLVDKAIVGGGIM